MAEALLGGGCFWCLEALFRRVPGVQKVVSGYAGCNSPHPPTYREVSRGETGCAEAVLIHYDPERVNYEELLLLFFALHDPTQLNRQGADVGSQYRSVIFPLSQEQRRIAEEVRERMDSMLGGRVVTTIEEYGTFYPAEEYHQNYYERNPSLPYCRFVIRPKLEKLKEIMEYPDD
ncbi:MAG: peptide-methionine (S)-S-oxide reductase MsrA [Epsilonproteobacteria bacterium]|nr:peptide-methionine (S)-S-oxide reductase [Campylobacterota bacterium]NPA57079.1 peptide-methionine (S)-S-oxide reductase MsrA [Campylobacterota bacterium]